MIGLHEPRRHRYTATLVASRQVHTRGMHAQAIVSIQSSSFKRALGGRLLGQETEGHGPVRLR